LWESFWIRQKLVFAIIVTKRTATWLRLPWGGPLALGVFAARGLFFSTLVGRRKKVAQKQSSSRNQGRVRPATVVSSTTGGTCRSGIGEQRLCRPFYFFFPTGWRLPTRLLCRRCATDWHPRSLLKTCQHLCKSSRCVSSPHWTSKACFGSCIRRTYTRRSYRSLCSFCLASPPSLHLLF
jgi:hypothetical protein